jgi:transketolase
MIQEQQPDIDQLCVNTLRTLSIDAIQKANSGHPGTPLDVVLGMRTFGMSAPMKVVAEHFGFTVEHVVTVAKGVLARRQ